MRIKCLIHVIFFAFCIEQTFGVWKVKFVIIRNIWCYDLQTQCKIVVATMALQIFIRKSKRTDEDFQKYEQKENDMFELSDSDDAEAQTTSCVPTENAHMAGNRNNIAEQIWREIR